MTSGQGATPYGIGLNHSLRNVTLRISAAINFADMAHAGIKRKYTGEPYVQHLLNVASLVSRKTADEDLVVAAILHDTIEDTAVKYQDIVDRFGARVADIVVELTDVYTHEAFPGKNRAERKELECARLATISADAKLIKICDISDNTSDIVANDPGFAVVYLREEASMLAVLLHEGP